MPVSSPSYFPPNTSTDQITGINAGHLATSAPRFLAGANAGNNSTAARLIIIGDNSGKGGIVSALLAGSIILGNSSAQALVSNASSAESPSALIIIGDQAIPGMTNADSSILIGQGIAPVANGAAFLQGSVIIGNGILASMTTSHHQDSVLIGLGVLANMTNFGGLQNVVIGSGAVEGCIASLTDGVFIGYQSCIGLGATGGTVSGNTIIGAQTSLGAVTAGNVVVGNLAAVGNAAGGGENVVIGHLAVAGSPPSTDLGNNVVIGSHAATPNGAGQIGGNVIIGASAGTTLPSTGPSSNFVVETKIAPAGQLALLFGNFASGNLIIGNSVDGGINRDFGGVPGTNMLKLLNGTAASGANIKGGGYFYVSGGILHWVDSSGTDSQLSESVTGQLASSALVPYTNNAGAQLATTTNGPLAGNPTKWIPINDNGTIRNIPAW